MKTEPAYIVIDTNVLISASASILISGDPDLTEVRLHQGVEVLSPAHFFERFKPL